MEGYGYPYSAPYPQVRRPEGEYPDHGDGFGEYYGLGPLNEERGRRSRSKHRPRKSNTRTKTHTRTRSRTDSVTKSRSRSRSQSRSKSRSRSHSRSRSRSRATSHTRSRTHSETHQKEINYKEPGFLDAFRVLYLTSSSKRNPSKFLATKKRQDHIHEILKQDGLGSKRWLFYPRQKNYNNIGSQSADVAGGRDNCDQRIKVDGEFFRKYKRSKKIDTNAPIAKLKRWELIFYKKLGFLEAV